MLTGELRGQIDKIWDSFWSGGIANPLEVMEQITYMLFLRRLDDLHTLEENKANRLGKQIERRIFPTGKDEKKRSYEDLRWSRFKNFTPAEMFIVVNEHVFPFIRKLGGDGSTYSHHMKDARFTIPTPALLAKVVDLIDHVPMEDRDTKGDIYEYMLSKIASAGQNGQFRTPRHIIKMMVEMTQPNPKDIIVDPASGTCGFLVAASEYLRENHPEILRDSKLKKHFHENAFHGFDFDNTMLRIGSMNMLLHGVENPDVRYRDSLSQDHAEEEKYSLILANPPFSGSLDEESVSKELKQVIKSRKTELLFVALFSRLLKHGGRCAVIVPSGVIESDSSAHTSIRKMLVDDLRLQAVITLPHWVFKPYASVATAILLFSKGGETESVLFYRLENDGFNNDANKTLKEGSEIPAVLSILNNIKDGDYLPSLKKHRLVSRQEIIENEYDLCDRVYLSGYDYPAGVELQHLTDLFNIEKGTIGAAQATNGPFAFVTSSEEIKRCDSWVYDCEAICIPIVSSTGHGHASIKRIHYVNEKFSAATITAVLIKKDNAEVNVKYIYYYLLAHKNELLVPLMRGSANVALSVERLEKLRVPVPSLKIQNQLIEEIEVANVVAAKKRKELYLAEAKYENCFNMFKESY